MKNRKIDREMNASSKASLGELQRIKMVLIAILNGESFLNPKLAVFFGD